MSLGTVIYTLVSSVDELIQLPGIPMDTYNKIREKCESLESIRDKFSKRLGKDPSPILRKRTRDAVETRKSLRVKREKDQDSETVEYLFSNRLG